MMDSTPPVLDLFGIEDQVLRMCIKVRLSISPLNLVLKAKEKILQEKILQKKMRDESLLSTQVGFHHHLSEDQESKAGGTYFHSSGFTLGLCSAAGPGRTFSKAMDKAAYPEIWSRNSQVNAELSSKPENTRPLVSASMEVWI